MASTQKTMPPDVEEYARWLQAVYERSIFAVFVHDFEGHLLEANDAALQLIGYARGSLPSLNIASLAASEGEEGRVRECLRNLLIEGTQPEPKEIQLRKKDGAEFWVMADCSLLRRHGEPYAMITIALDITARKQTEAREAHLVRLSTMVREVNELIVRETDQKRLVDKACDVLGSLPGVVSAWIALFEDDYKVSFSAHAGNPDDFELFLDDFSRSGPPPCMQAILETAEAMLLDAQKRSELCCTCRSACISADHEKMLAPIRAGNRTLGVVGLTLPAGQVAVEGEKALLREVAEDIGTGLRRIQNEEDMRRSAERYRALVEAQAVFICRSKPDSIRLFVNDAYCRFVGKSREQILGTGFLDQLPAEERESYVNRLAHLNPDSPAVTSVIRSRRSDDQLRWIEWVDQGVFDQRGRLVELVSVGYDVTEKKAATDALKASEKRYRTISDAAFEGLVVTKDNVVVDVNVAFLAMFGYTREEAIGKPIARFVAPEDRGMVLERLSSGNEQTYEHRALRKDNTVFDVEVQPRAVSYDGQRERFTAIRDITERKRGEKALRESEERYRTLVEAAGDAIFLMDRSAFLDCNTATLRMFGCTREQIIGTHPSEFSPPTQPDGRNSMDAAQEWIDAALAGIPQFFEWKHCAADGTPFDAEVSLNKTTLAGKDLLLAIVRNITERKATENALRESEEKFRNVVEQSADGVALLDREGRVIEWNPALSRITSFEKGDVMGRNALQVGRDLCPKGKEEVAEKLVERLHGMLEGTFEGEFRSEMEVIGRDGALRVLGISLFTIDLESGRLIGAIGRDRTALHQARMALQRHANELAQTNSALQAANEELRVLNRTKSDFVATASHEIRTPLTSIIAFAETLLTPELGLTEEERQKSLNCILKEGRRLGRMVSSMLDLARIEKGTFELHRTRFTMRELVDQTVEAAHVPGDKTIRLDSRYEGQLTVNADPDRIIQVLLNIVDNALRYTPTGGAVAISLDADEHNIRVGVHDQGPGIAPEELERIFEPFYQSTRREVRRASGAGLGLSLAKQIVEAHGGRIWAESEVGKGTKVFFTLTRAEEGME